MLLNFGRNIVNKFHAIITHIYDNHIKFEVSLDFWQIWPTVWHPYFRTNLETSGNFSKCFVCIGSIFQIGYTLLQRTKAKVTMVIHYLCNKARSDFSTNGKTWNCTLCRLKMWKRNTICYGKIFDNCIPSVNVWRVSSTPLQVGFHLPVQL